MQQHSESGSESHPYMRNQAIIDVIIPAYNEEKSLPFVLNDLKKQHIRQVIVADNNSTDGTAAVAKAGGAEVVFQPDKGYGNACLKAMEYLQNLPLAEQPDIVVFMDADYADYPEELPLVVAPILHKGSDMVIGSRLKGNMEPGAMTTPQKFGNWLAPALIRWLFGYDFSDLGPFRALKWQSLLAMHMQDKNFGWTVEMQVRAAQLQMNCTEVAVSYRKRAGGKSKVSGTIKGTFQAGWKILFTVFKLYFKHKN